MRTFIEWQKEMDEGLRSRLAIGAALAGSAFGAGNVNAGNPPAQTADVGQDMFPPSEKSWNSELGDFRAIKFKDGSIVYRTAKGDFKRVKSPLSSTGFKFVKIG